MQGFDPCSRQSPVAQWLEHPTRSRRVVGSNPIWRSDFSESTFLLELVFQKPFREKSNKNLMILFQINREACK